MWTRSSFEDCWTSGWQAQGVEISPKLCNHAAEYSNCKVFCDSVESNTLPIDTFDIVIMVDTFRTLNNPLLALKNCARACKPDGAIVIRDLNISRKHSFNRFLRSDEYDLQCLSPQTAREFMRRVGITNVLILPSPMSLMTIPAMTHFHPVIKRLLMRGFNAMVQMFFNLSLRKWLNIVPEMLVIGFVDKHKSRI